MMDTAVGIINKVRYILYKIKIYKYIKYAEIR